MEFDDIAPKYDNWYETPIGRLADKVENRIIQGLSKIRPGERVLDVGCGTGLYTIRAAEAGAIVTGIDPSEAMLKRFREKLETLPTETSKRITVMKGNAEAIQLPDGSVDLVLSVTALEFCPDAGKALKEFYRVLRPGGRVIVGVLNSRGWWARYRKRRKGSIHEKAHYYSREELLSLFSRQFRDVEVRNCVMVPPKTPAFFIPLFRKLEPTLAKLFPKGGAFLAVRGWKK
ncbi:MAG: class I SAM-dependent methyltransferase [Thermoplasmata archaeon]|nr:class I SAM-dependent methyltransferase [Thermoplasmata archaeon]